VISPGTCTHRTTAGCTCRRSILISKIFVFDVTRPASMPATSANRTRAVTPKF
jgi:hypothetical protein